MWPFNARKKTPSQVVFHQPRRNFEGASTNRLNQAHWSNAVGSNINQYCITQLKTLRDRCRYEAYNNGYIAGMIETHATGLIGAEGPTLQIKSDDKDYNSAIESAWRDWWEMPDLAGKMSGPELLRDWVRSLWTCGNYVCQITKNEDEDLRLNNIHPSRMVSPAGNKDNIVCGVEFDKKSGRPTVYHIADSENFIDSLNISQIKADDIIHGYLQIETAQVVGVPVLSPVLEVVAQLRDTYTSILDSVRNCAAYNAVYELTDPSAEPVVVQQEMEIQRGTSFFLPPGYTTRQIIPTQPGATFESFSDELLRQIGRPACMPLMIVKMSFENLNYSSARANDLPYRADIEKYRSRIALSLKKIFARFKAEFDLERKKEKLPVPDSARSAWLWPAIPQFDPIKEAGAVEARLRNKTTTLRDECAKENLDWEEVVDQLAVELQKLKSAGLIEEKPSNDMASV